MILEGSFKAVHAEKLFQTESFSNSNVKSEILPLICKKTASLDLACCFLCSQKGLLNNINKKGTQARQKLRIPAQKNVFLKTTGLLDRV